MEMQGWGGFLVIIGLIRTFAEVVPVSNVMRKAVVVTCAFLLSYYYGLDAIGLLGLHIVPTAWHAHEAWLAMNSAFISLATFMGHDALDQLKGSN